MPLSLCGGFFFFLLLAPAAAASTIESDLEMVRAAEDARVRVMAAVAPTVVSILEEDRSGGGSGVVITPDGYALTNFHVIMNMLRTRRGVAGMADGRLYPFQVLGIDPTGDMAMIKLDSDEPFQPAELGDSDEVRIGDWVFAMGNPFLLAEDYTPTVTHGIVSGVNRYQFGADGRSLVYTDCIQVDASINPGNSGGPLFDMQGRLIGINGRASFEQRGRVNVGLGYAISINQIKRFIPGLRAGLLTEHGSLGATAVDIGYRQVVFEKMLDPSAASVAGIQIGDRLVEFAGRQMHSSNHFANILGVFPAGWPVPVVFEREGRRISRTVRLERLPLNRGGGSFQVDADLNQAQAERVLAACQEAVGTLGESVTIRWRGQRRQMLSPVGDGRDVLSAWQGPHILTPAPVNDVQVWTLEGVETAGGRGECRVLDANKVEAVYIYTGRSTAAHDAAHTPLEVDAVHAARLNLAMLARMAVYTPLDEEQRGRWRHRGGDEYQSRVVDVLEYDAPDSDALCVAIDPETGNPVRIMWRPPPSPSREPPVELELEDYRLVEGIKLPHQILTYVGGELVMIDQITAYEVEGQP